MKSAGWRGGESRSGIFRPNFRKMTGRPTAHRPQLLFRIRHLSWEGSHQPLHSYKMAGGPCLTTTELGAPGLVSETWEGTNPMRASRERLLHAMGVRPTAGGSWREPMKIGETVPARDPPSRRAGVIHPRTYRGSYSIRPSGAGTSCWNADPGFYPGLFSPPPAGRRTECCVLICPYGRNWPGTNPMRTSRERPPHRRWLP